MRLIDADELVREIDELRKDAGFYRPIYEGFLRQINEAPTIDAVPVVRCKDCIHYEPCEGGKDFCCWHATGIVADDFCSYGERKDGGKDG